MKQELALLSILQHVYIWKQWKILALSTCVLNQKKVKNGSQISIIKAPVAFLTKASNNFIHYLRDIST